MTGGELILQKYTLRSQSDDTYVLGKITADETASITAEDLESEVTVLVPLN